MNTSCVDTERPVYYKRYTMPFLYDFRCNWIYNTGLNSVDKRTQNGSGMNDFLIDIALLGI